MSTIQGGVAQLEERLLCKQEVRGSSPLVSTTLPKGGPKGSGYRGLESQFRRHPLTTPVVMLLAGALMLALDYDFGTHGYWGLGTGSLLAGGGLLGALGLVLLPIGAVLAAKRWTKPIIVTCPRRHLRARDAVEPFFFVRESYLDYVAVTCSACKADFTLPATARLILTARQVAHDTSRHDGRARSRSRSRPVCPVAFDVLHPSLNRLVRNETAPKTKHVVLYVSNPPIELNRRLIRPANLQIHLGAPESGQSLLSRGHEHPA